MLLTCSYMCFILTLHVVVKQYSTGFCIPSFFRCSYMYVYNKYNHSAPGSTKSLFGDFFSLTVLSFDDNFWPTCKMGGARVGVGEVRW